MPTFQTFQRTRVRHTKSKAAPIPAAHRAEIQAARAERSLAIDSEIRDWHMATIAKANDLGTRFKKKPRYFLDLFFQGGAHLTRKNKKVNVHNAFLRMKAMQMRTGKQNTDFAELAPLLTIHHSRRNSNADSSSHRQTQRRI